MSEPLAVVGATGVLGRPLVRVLHERGRRFVCVVRNEDEARRVLPAGVECRVADLRDEVSLARSLDGCAAVYTNLCQPFSSRAWDPDLHGTRALIAASRRAGVRRFLRISALGCPEWRERWWVIRNKSVADEDVRESGMRWTIFKPTWLMESLPLFMMGPAIASPPAPSVPLHWIAGEDYARQVDAALDSEQARDREYLVQGPEPVTMRDAIRRFRAAHRPRMPIVPMWGPGLRAAAMLAPRPRYLRDVLAMTWGTDRGFVAGETWRELGEPRMRIEDYARSIDRTRDVPRK